MYVFFCKQELYFVKENYEIFSTEVSAREKQEQNSGGPHQGVPWRVSWNFIRRSAILNLIAGWGVLEPQCSMQKPLHCPILISSDLL